MQYLDCFLDHTVSKQRLCKVNNLMLEKSKLQQVDNHGIYKKRILTLTGLWKSNEKNQDVEQCKKN